MQKLTVTFMALLLAIASYGTVYAADSDETAYEIQEEHAAPVTITELPGSDQFAPGVARELKGARLDSETAAEATSIDDQQQASETDRRQRMIEQCEQNNSVDCASDVDTELRAETIQRHSLVHMVPPAGASR